MADTTINDTSGNLTYADLERTWKLLNEIKPTLYYAVSEYLKTDKIYTMPAYGEELYAMHPDSFPAFEREALAAGYRLVTIGPNWRTKEDG